MASEIEPDPAPLLASAVGSPPPLPEMTVNQASLNDVLEACSTLLNCVTQMLQEMPTGQLSRHQELGTEDRTREPTLSHYGQPLEVAREFEACLSDLNCDRLLQLVDEIPDQLLLQTFSKDVCWSALHVAVWKGSLRLVEALLEKLRALSRGGESESAQHDFISKTDEFGLSAPDLAAVVANQEITACFRQSFGFYLEEAVAVRPNDTFVPIRRSQLSGGDRRKLEADASALLDKRAPASLQQGSDPISWRDWLHHHDVEFLYCLHNASRQNGRKCREFIRLVCEDGDASFLEPLLQVRDEDGGSPLHLVQNRFSDEWISRVILLFETWDTHFPSLDWNTPDFGGRTPLHWAAAHGYVDLVAWLTRHEKVDLNATYRNLCGRKLKESANFRDSSVVDVTPLHLAAIHNHVGVVEALLKVPKGRGLEVNALCQRRVHSRFESEPDVKSKWTPFQLAALMGHEQTLQAFLKDLRLYDPGLKSGNQSAPRGHNMTQHYI